MANILLISASITGTGTSYTRTKAAFEAGGHTVTGCVSQAALLATVDLTGIDVIATARASNAAGVESWIRDKWAAGYPILTGGDADNVGIGVSGGLAQDLGICQSLITDLSSQGLAVTAGNPVTTGYSGTVAVMAGSNINSIDTGTPAGALVGTIAGSKPGAYMAAVDLGAALHAGSYAPGTTAPARAIYCGWLYAGQTDYTADGKTILNQAVDWLTAPSILLVTADTTHVAATNTKAAMVAAGNAVTLVADSTLDSVSTARFDLVATVRTTKGSAAVSSWVRDQWAAGKPVLLGGGEAGITGGETVHTGKDVGILAAPLTAAPDYRGNSLLDVATHPITSGYAAGTDVTIRSNYTVADTGTPWGLALGTIPGAARPAGPGLVAVETGSTINAAAPDAPGSTAPTRAVFFGEMYAGQADYSAAGKLLIAQAIQWLLAATPVTPTPTVITGVHVGLTFAASHTQPTTLATGARVALEFTARASVSATTATGARVGLGFAATSHEHGASKVSTPVQVGLAFTARATHHGTITTGVHVGLAFTASIPGQAITLTTGVHVGLTFAASGGDVLPPPWTADTIGRNLLQIEIAEPVTLDIRPPLAVAPATITERALPRVAFPGLPVAATDAAAYETRETYGVPHLFVGGQDITYLRDVPTQIGTFSDELPGGENTLEFQTPQVQPTEAVGAGDLGMFTADANVDLELVLADGTRKHVWAGRLVLDDPGRDDASSNTQWQAVGALTGSADHRRHRAPIIQDPEDIGKVIPRVLNGVVSRRYSAIPNATTGIDTADRGTWGDTAWGYVQSLLGTAWTDDQRQWTIAPVAPRVYRLRLKQDPGAPTWTYTMNQPGLTVDLPEDQTQRVNVVYGHGVEASGAAWANWKFPDISPDDAPDYPFHDASRTINVGVTDAMTDTGDGVSVWQQGAVNLGYDIKVDGVYNTTDEAVVKRVQAQCGLQVDGSIGPQTWVATFQTGSNAGDLNNATRLPLAYDKRVWPWLHAANGAVVGDNPDYDPSIEPYEIDVDFGTGIQKSAGTTSSRQMLARDKAPGRTGTITATTDPHEGHKLDVQPGHKLVLQGARGGNLALWVVDRKADLAGNTVTWTVDEKARDAMTLAAIQSRNIAAGETPDGRPLPIHRKSHQSTDVVTQFDVESRAGIVPRLPLFNNLWTVVNVPVTLTGTISVVELTTDSPKCEFVVAIFGAPITPAHLLHYVGNPFSEAGAQNWTKNNDLLLDRFAWCEKYGDSDQPCGYSPGNKGDGAPLTGRLLDNNPLSFTSTRGGRAWVAFYATQDTWIHGRIRSGPIPV